MERTCIKDPYERPSSNTRCGRRKNITEKVRFSQAENILLCQMMRLREIKSYKIKLKREKKKT